MDITLALGGGGSKGYAHIGVIRGLENMGFNIKGIAGTSAGGLAAAVYAAGFTTVEILDMASNIRQDNLYGLGRGPGLLGVKGIQEVMSQFLGDKTFSDLVIPCALSAVDLVLMKEVVIQEGRLIDAVMATIAIPGIFPPREWADLLLVDGMVLNPVPVNLARSLVPSLPVVAVTLSPLAEELGDISPWGRTPQNLLLRPISKLRVAKAFEVYLRSMEMTSHKLSEVRLELEKPEVLIRPAIWHIGAMDRVNVREVADLGEMAVELAKTSLEKLIKGQKRRRWFSREPS
ncbi:MAG: patatin-like phospholipase family protein [Anaerolineales bacterium]|nr:patatin-like phospholipase family protein [Anaerolineales bacterium]